MAAKDFLIWFSWGWANAFIFRCQNKSLVGHSTSLPMAVYALVRKCFWLCSIVAAAMSSKMSHASFRRRLTLNGGFTHHNICSTVWIYTEVPMVSVIKDWSYLYVEQRSRGTDCIWFLQVFREKNRAILLNTDDFGSVVLNIVIYFPRSLKSSLWCLRSACWVWHLKMM